MGRVAERAKAIERQQQERSAASQAAAEIATQRRDLVAIAEQIIRSRAAAILAADTIWAPRMFFTADEVAVFDSLAWDAPKLRREMSRIATMVRWEAEAGTSAERTAAAERLAAADTELCEQAPALEAEMAKLQRQLSALQRAKRDAAVEVDRREGAIKHLQELAPSEAVEERDRRILALAPLRQAYGEAVLRQQRIQTLVGLNVDGPDGWRQASLCAETWGRSDLQRHANDRYVDMPGWLKFVDELKPELPELEARIAEQRAKLDAAMSDADALLSVYVR